MAIDTFDLVFLILSVPFTTYVLWTLITALESSKWPYVTGRIVTSEPHIRDEREKAWRQPQVEYEYSVDGAMHRGEGVWIGESLWGPKPIEPAPELLRRYAVGVEVRVYYNPRRPRESALIPGMNRAMTAAVLVALVLFTGALWTVFTR